jgi:hypothetical protein
MGGLFPHIRKDFKVKSSDIPPFRAERIHSFEDRDFLNFLKI